MTRLAAGGAIDVLSAQIALEPLDAAIVRAGSPQAGIAALDGIGGHEIGVWEHTPGVSTDLEADEVFVVVAGSGVLAFEQPALPPIDLRPGVVVRLAEGMRTVWTVRETIRKVYIA